MKNAAMLAASSACPVEVLELLSVACRESGAVGSALDLTAFRKAHFRVFGPDMRDRDSSHSARLFSAFLALTNTTGRVARPGSLPCKVFVVGCVAMMPATPHTEPWATVRANMIFQVKKKKRKKSGSNACSLF